jgi:C-terminal processing protease CtpA/Prc
VVPVTLTIKRENVDDLLEFTIIRDTITVEAVKEKLLEEGKLAIFEFLLLMLILHQN